MPIFLLLLGGAVIGGLIAAFSSDEQPRADEQHKHGTVNRSPVEGTMKIGHSNGGHPFGGNFTKHYSGYRSGHHRIGSDGRYIY